MSGAELTKNVGGKQETGLKRPGQRSVTVALLIPVLNEEIALQQILPQLDPGWVDEILFVDGGSVDRTVEVIRQWGHGRLVIQKQHGLSNAYWESFPHIRSQAILTFSPDGNSPPEAIPRLVEAAQEGWDMIIASRYLPGAGSEDDDPVTAFGNWMFTRTINWLFNGRYTDCLVMLRIYRRELIEQMRMYTRAPVFEQQLAIRCAVFGRRVHEIPAREPKRIGGVRKMKVLVNGWATVDLIAREWVRLKLFGEGRKR